MLLGFDIGGTKCAVVLGEEKKDKAPAILHREVIQTNGKPGQMIDRLFTIAQSLLHKHNSGYKDLAGIGISCGGPLNSKKGIILSPPNLPGWDHIPMVARAEQHFGVKAVLQNDANACAVAEWKYGAGAGYENLIFLTFGTGMGAGLILNGNLYSGSTDLAGEVGHMRLTETGPVGFGKAGSLEGYCSGGGIAQLAQIKVREQLQMGKNVSFCDSLDDLPMLTAKLVADAARNGDQLALTIYKECGHYLGKGLSILIDILNPQIIILGSIYGRTKDLLEEDMQEQIRREALKDSYSNCKIVSAGLGEQIGDYAALSLALMAMEPAGSIQLQDQ